ncbi:MAG TPA: PQQ-binding-like beta-propeller repeat protein, partial [Planctomycetota bacterium]|nr:PQQ-binding-like beta-propeller repeat protein [Planctomycetota bacterium]
MKRSVFVLVLAAGLTAPAQEEEFSQKNTAHIKLYPESDELLGKAPGLAAQQRFAEALEIYAKALEAPADMLVEMSRTQAIGVRDYVVAQLAAWPEAGQEAIRRRYDPAVEQAFQSAKRSLDVEALEKLVDEAPFSSFTGEALSLIGNLWLDAGEPARAAAALERCLAAGGGTDRAVATARLAQAWARLGEKARLEALARRAEAELPGARVVVAGREAELAAHLHALADTTTQGVPPPPLDIPGWEMMAGHPRGWRLAEAGVRLPRFAWSDEVPLPRLEGDEDFGLRRMRMPAAPTADFRPLFPAVADGVLYVQNGLSVTAYNLFGRLPEKLWQFRLQPPGAEVMFDNRVVHTVSVHDGLVFANLITAVGGAEDQLGYVRVKFPFPRRALYALDATSGKLLWKVGGEVRADALEANASFSVAPTPENGRLYVGAIKQMHSTDPFEHHLLCLDAATGRTIWSTFVASGGTEINLFGNSTRESLGSPVS